MNRPQTPLRLETERNVMIVMKDINLMIFYILRGKVMRECLGVQNMRMEVEVTVRLEA